MCSDIDIYDEIFIRIGTFEFGTEVERKVYRQVMAQNERNHPITQSTE
jgi:hypothetical protein